LWDVEMRHTSLKESELEIAHFLPIDYLSVEIETELIDDHLDIVYGDVGIPAAVYMEHQRAKTELRHRQVQEIGAVQSSAHAHDAIEGLSVARSLDAPHHLPEYRCALFVGVPVGQHISLEAYTMVADAGIVENDLAVTGIHDAVITNFVFDHDGIFPFPGLRRVY